MRAERQRLAGGPVDPLAAARSSRTAWLRAGGRSSELAPQTPRARRTRRLAHRGRVSAGQSPSLLPTAPRPRSPISAGSARPNVPLQPIRLVRPDTTLGSLERLSSSVWANSSHIACASAACQQCPRAASRSAYSVRVVLPVADGAVHGRLGEGRLVGLVVAVTAVADDVEHDVDAESPGGTRPRVRAHQDHRLGVVAVDVQDRHLDGFGHVGAIQARNRRGPAPW